MKNKDFVGREMEYGSIPVGTVFNNMENRRVWIKDIRGRGLLLIPEHPTDVWNPGLNGNFSDYHTVKVMGFLSKLPEDVEKGAR